MIKRTFIFGTMAILVFSVIGFGVSDSYSLLVPKSTLELYQENEIILIGNVSSLTENASEGFTDYEIKIEKFMKKTTVLTSSSTIFATGSGAMSSEIHHSTEKIFNVNDRVFLFLNEKDGKYKISSYSFNAQLYNPDDEFLLPPLTLHRAGISSDEIVCKNNHELILKANSGSPACVTSNTKAKLIERGWALP